MRKSQSSLRAQQHPGGDEVRLPSQMQNYSSYLCQVLISEAGKDATDAFEDVGHSDEAREIMAKYLVGTADVRRVLLLQTFLMYLRTLNRTHSLVLLLEKLVLVWISEHLPTLSRVLTEGAQKCCWYQI